MGHEVGVSRVFWDFHDFFVFHLQENWLDLFKLSGALPWTWESLVGSISPKRGLEFSFTCVF
jgi:hypothetical protein